MDSKNLCLERAVIRTQGRTRSAFSSSPSIINTKPSYPERYRIPQCPIHPISQWLYMSWITVGLEISYYSPIKCHYPAVIRAMLCVCVVFLCVCACWRAGIMIPCRALQKGFARVKWDQIHCKSNCPAGGICFLLAHFLLSVCLLNCCVYISRKGCTSSANFIWHAGSLTFTIVTAENK